ncbi:hypothetical protein OAM67_01765 [bacterium]|nr:hypothetical protein [bacterium]
MNKTGAATTGAPASMSYKSLDFGFGGPPVNPDDPPLLPVSLLPPATLETDPHPLLVFAGSDWTRGVDFEDFVHDITFCDKPEFMCVDCSLFANPRHVFEQVIAAALLTLPTSFYMNDRHKELSVSVMDSRSCERVSLAVRLYNQPSDGIKAGFKIGVFRRCGDETEVYSFFGRFAHEMERIMRNMHVPSAVDDEGDCAESKMPDDGTSLQDDGRWLRLANVEQQLPCQCCVKKAVTGEPPHPLHLHDLKSWDTQQVLIAAKALLHYSCRHDQACWGAASNVVAMDEFAAALKASDPYAPCSAGEADGAGGADAFATQPRNRDVFVCVSKVIVDAAAGATTAKILTPSIVATVNGTMPSMLRYINRFKDDVEGSRVLLQSLRLLFDVGFDVMHKAAFVSVEAAAKAKCTFL